MSNEEMEESRSGDGARHQLHLAVLSQKLPVVLELIEKGAAVNALDENGQSPLHYAARGHDAHILELLIQKGADVSVKDKQSLTPLRISILHKNWRMVEAFEGMINLKNKLTSECRLEKEFTQNTRSR